MLAMGLIFQMPAITYVLSRIGIVSAGLLIDSWKIAIDSDSDRCGGCFADRRYPEPDAFCHTDDGSLRRFHLYRLVFRPETHDRRAPSNGRNATRTRRILHLEQLRIICLKSLGYNLVSIFRLATRPWKSRSFTAMSTVKFYSKVCTDSLLLVSGLGTRRRIGQKPGQGQAERRTRPTRPETSSPS